MERKIKIDTMNFNKINALYWNKKFSIEQIANKLGAYAYQDINVLKSYWYRITRIPLSQFTKPYIRDGNLNLSQRKLVYGLVHIRYNDKKLLETIKTWIKDYTTIFQNGQVPKWPKGTDCVNAASYRKARWKSR